MISDIATEAMNDIATSIIASALWTACIALIGVAWYLIGGRAREKAWIREHGLMLLVYFRNVDWRCCKLRELLTSGCGAPRHGHDRLLAMLVKLEADLDAFDRLAKMWARRLEGFQLWYPYARTIRAFLEAQDELHVALCRHTAPLRHHLERNAGVAPRPGGVDELSAYARYFLGGSDRLWGPSPNPPLMNTLPGHLAMCRLRYNRLAQRLQCVFEALSGLLRKDGEVDCGQLQIWYPNENPAQVWFPTHEDPDRGQVSGPEGQPAPPGGRPRSPEGSSPQAPKRPRADVETGQEGEKTAVPA